jgi:AcrR family transcriptional regulator
MSSAKLRQQPKDLELFRIEHRKGNCSGMDRRVQKTRQALQAALITLILERGYETLTVQDVLDRANVGRSTFYAHFYDLDDLLQSEFEVLQREFEQHLAQHPVTEPNLWEISTLMFQHAQAYQRLYQAVVGKESGKLIQKHLQDYLRQQIRARLTHDGGVLKHLEIIETYLVSSFMGLLIWWLDKGLPYSPAEMAQLYQDLSKDGLDKFAANDTNSGQR